MLTRGHAKIPLLAICLSSMLSLVACGGGSVSIDDENKTEETLDSTPDNFTFLAVKDIGLNTQVESNLVVIKGINTAIDISISGGEYSINDGSYTSLAGKLNNGDSLRIRVSSANTYQTESVATVSVNAVNKTFSVTTMAQPIVDNDIVQVNVKLNTKHSIGGIDKFERKKYINIHASSLENDWGQNDGHSLNAPNELGENLMLDFMQGYDVYFGRDTGSIGWNLRNVSEDANRAGFVDEASASQRGGDVKWVYDKNSGYKYVNARLVEDRMQDMIMGGQQHPYWPEGTLINPVNGDPAWAFSQTDTAQEPFGTATGHYMSQFLAKFFALNDNDLGQAQPVYFEVMNEPLYDLTTDREGQANYVEPLKVFEFHNTVAAEIRKNANNDNVMVGGYTIAFPDFDKDNFKRWEDRDKLFIDTAGDNMDFISLHLYDFPTFQNSERYRRGSNLEATLDMLEHYTYLKYGAVKPMLISEVGSSVHARVNQAWTPQRDAEKVRSITTMNTQFLQRPNTILKVIPFIPVKAEWGRRNVNGNSIAYSSRLMMQQKERDGSDDNTWVYSDHVYFYQLWSEVNGTRVDTSSSEVDLLTESYVDGNTAYVVLTNLEFDDIKLAVNTLGLTNNDLQSVDFKLLSYSDNNETQFTEQSATELPENIELPAEATMIVKLVYANDINITESTTEQRYYATSYQQEIVANTSINFAFNSVQLGTDGQAVLRLGIGRDHGKSLTPIVNINGNSVKVPSDVQGYDQKQGKNSTGRPNFFGVVEIPVTYDQLQQNNTVTVEFSDTGGYVSSAVLQVLTAN
ncbi:hypothetical protein N7931_11510 [Catenovulum sp. 2E275]|uniref:hypothetical protein n=1 Tax=Catenovulum sp. 2E275 TaxID=2980497 RepID=UPI0021CE95CA|nr:hypothetical protein [Catenovulum sp. 2E275]MCU4676256.1 hypothetical protein [Catenovulum sp. 2E275]